MTEQKLDSPEIARPLVDHGLGSSPTLAIHSDTRRAYWRVVMLVLGPRRPVNKNSPGLLLAAFI
jgi:hypothetical protein